MTGIVKAGSGVVLDSKRDVMTSRDASFSNFTLFLFRIGLYRK